MQLSRRRTRTDLFVCAVWLLAMAGAAPARGQDEDKKEDVVVLENGERLLGTIKYLEYGKLRLSTDELDTVYVKWEFVTHLESAQAFEVEDLSAHRYFGTLGAGPEPGTIEIVHELGSATLAVDEVLRIHPIHRTFWGRVDGSVSAGLNVVTASDIYQLSSHLDATYTGRRYQNSLTFDTMFNDARDEATRASRQDLILDASRLLRGLWTWVGSAAARSNDELGLDLRLTVEGAGLYRLIRRPGHVLAVGAGLALGRENFADGNGSSTVEAVLAARQRLFAFAVRDLDATWDLRVYPSLSDSGRYRVELVGNARRELIEDFIMSINLNYSFDSQTVVDPEGEELDKDDLSLTFSLGYKF